VDCYTDTAEQAELRSAMRDLLSREADPSEAWKRLTGELGVTGLSVPESCGGAGAGLAEVAVAVEEAGRVLLPLPVLPTALAGAVLSEGGTSANAGVLTGIAAGELRAAFAFGGQAGFAGGRLTGSVSHVMHGPEADVFLVGAEEGASAVLCLVRATDADVTPARTLDQTRSQATVTFRGSPAVVTDTDPARAEELLRVLLAVECAGAAAHCLEVTVAYLKTREQFGRPIGGFQALRHRTADLAVAVASAQATARAAVRAAVAEPAGLPVLGPLSKRHCAGVFWQVAAEMLQLHGGIGFTWEHQTHRYLKRAKSTQLLHGSPAELRRLVTDRAGLTQGSG
jgi:alkylation response protein AidB-like acyl-CoA dehydrogenase